MQCAAICLIFKIFSFQANAKNTLAITMAHTHDMNAHKYQPTHRHTALARRRRTYPKSVSGNHASRWRRHTAPAACDGHAPKCDRRKYVPVNIPDIDTGAPLSVCFDVASTGAGATTAGHNTRLWHAAPPLQMFELSATRQCAACTAGGVVLGAVAMCCADDSRV